MVDFDAASARFAKEQASRRQQTVAAIVQNLGEQLVAFRDTVIQTYGDPTAR